MSIFERFRLFDRGQFQIYRRILNRGIEMRAHGRAGNFRQAATMDYQQHRKRIVEEQIRARGVRDTRVLAAMADN